MSPRDVEKLRAIGFDVKQSPENPGHWIYTVESFPSGGKTWCNPKQETASEILAWEKCRELADDLRATMADKVRWLARQRLEGITIWYITNHPEKWGAAHSKELMAQGPSPETALDELFWSVP